MMNWEVLCFHCHRFWGDYWLNFEEGCLYLRPKQLYRRCFCTIWLSKCCWKFFQAGRNQEQMFGWMIQGSDLLIEFVMRLRCLWLLNLKLLLEKKVKWWTKRTRRRNLACLKRKQRKRIICDEWMKCMFIVSLFCVHVEREVLSFYLFYFIWNYCDR